MLAMLLLIQVATAMPPPASRNPAPEALALGRQLAETGTLASLLPMIAAKEADEVVAAHPELGAPEQAAYRRSAAATLVRGTDRLFAAQARALAERLSPADLRQLVAFQRSPAAQRYRAALPAAIASAMAAMQGIDFKKDSWSAFCAETKRRC